MPMNTGEVQNQNKKQTKNLTSANQEVKPDARNDV
jgi:hypothetical protein